jgi:hypothetical protein
LVEKVSRRKKTCKRRYIDRKQHRCSQRRLQAQIDKLISELIGDSLEQSLQVETTQLLGRGKSERRDLDDDTVVEARCNKCGSRYRRQFYRAGFYKRSLLSLESWVQIRVPRLSCTCGGMVDFEYEHLEPYGRLWFDIQQRARELGGLCISLRDGVEVLAWRSGQVLSIATANRLVNEAGELAEAFHQGPLERVPQVVMLDGVWLKVLEPTGQQYTDKRGRLRQRMKARKFPLLVAYGIDPVSGQRWLLDWERGQEEDAASWARLLERLEERGLGAERGLELFVHDGSAGLEKAFELVYFGEGVEHQRCIFHKLRNVGRDVVGQEGMSRKELRGRRNAVVQDAAQVYRGQDESEIRQSLAAFKAKWQDEEPVAVATLARGFSKTITYLSVMARARTRGESWRIECVRATSALERVQRHFRQKARQVVVFHSDQGVKAATQLVIAHRRLALAPSGSWSDALEEALLAA